MACLRACGLNSRNASFARSLRSASNPATDTGLWLLLSSVREQLNILIPFAVA